jgi:hypothetical protein
MFFDAFSYEYSAGLSPLSGQEPVVFGIIPASFQDL